jgi:hypothetical protein
VKVVRENISKISLTPLPLKSSAIPETSKNKGLIATSCALWFADDDDDNDFFISPHNCHCYKKPEHYRKVSEGKEVKKKGGELFWNEGLNSNCPKHYPNIRKAYENYMSELYETKKKKAKPAGGCKKNDNKDRS